MLIGLHDIFRLKVTKKSTTAPGIFNFLKSKDGFQVFFKIVECKLFNIKFLSIIK